MKKGWIVFCHVLFWVCMILFFMFLAHDNSKITTQALLVIFLGYGVINISLFYVNYLVLVPRYLDHKKYGRYALMVLATIFVYGFLKYGIALQFRSLVLERMKGEPISFWSYFISAFFTSLIFMFLSTVLQFSVDWFTNERVQRDLENQRLSAELAFLRSQINPHFLFNSLNSIYSLAYQRSDTTPEAILKLSEIMRYMLYECNDNKVDLANELQYIQNYIDMQKIRFGKNAHIDFEVNGFVCAQRIVPLLLIAFVENAFKHGVANDPATPIKIIISINEEQLVFYIENKKHTHNRDVAGGIGLSNVKRRLDLLYPGKYSLNINDGDDSYICELSLYL